jgi:hypothetical protein
MSKKIQPRPPVAISGSQGSVKYVLEDVFWVPISNSRWKRSTSLVLPELHSEKLDTGEVSQSCDTESGSANNLR